MKNTIYSLLIIAFFTSCVNNSEEPTLDCSASNLNLEVESSIKSDCQNPGSVTLLATGDAMPLTYSANGVDFQEDRTMENLFAGDLEFFVKDANGCIESVNFVLESIGNAISLDISVEDSDCISGNTGSIEVTASGGSGDYSFSLNGGNPNNSGLFTALSSGFYTIEVTDSEGCKASSNATIDVITDVSLSGNITAIVISNCAISGCHNGSVSPNLSTKSAIIQNANSIKSRTSSRTMPPSSRPDLSDSQIQQIACWVDAGAIDN